MPCEHLFSSGKLIATDKHSRLGHEHFEELQVLKFAWHPTLVDHATKNSNEVEEAYITQDFTDLLTEERAILDWEKRTLFSGFQTNVTLIFMYIHWFQCLETSASSHGDEYYKMMSSIT